MVLHMSCFKMTGKELCGNQPRGNGKDIYVMSSCLLHEGTSYDNQYEFYF